MSTEDTDDLDARSQFVESIYELHSELASALEQEPMDPARVMRLTAHGVDYCMTALAVILEDSRDRGSDDL